MWCFVHDLRVKHKLREFLDHNTGRGNVDGIWKNPWVEEIEWRAQGEEVSWDSQERVS